MTEAALTPEQILEAAEEVLRRFGPAKATVVDVARVLGVSHGSVYRHFPSKAALRDAVSARWLERIASPLATIAAGETPPPVRLRHWLEGLIGTKRRLALDDPELFATYTGLVAESREVVTAHVEALVGQVAHIIADGVAGGDFRAGEVRAAARAVFDATARFHNPVHAGEWRDPSIDAAFEGVWGLVLAGLGGTHAAG